MRGKCLLLGALALLTVIAPAIAKGRHISCVLEGTISDGVAHKDIVRKLSFYLDDTGEQLISETSDISVHTTLYSDTIIRAELADSPVGYPSLFGMILREPSFLQIDRVNGLAGLGAEFVHGRAEVEHGACRENPGPVTKF
jgi:hypothetical protein